MNPYFEVDQNPYLDLEEDVGKKANIPPMPETEKYIRAREEAKFGQGRITALPKKGPVEKFEEFAGGMVPFLGQMRGEKEWRSEETMMEVPLMIGAGALLGETFKGIFRAIKGATWFRMLTNKQRGVVVQSLDDMIRQGYSEGEILRKWNNPTWRADALKRRMAGEAPLEPPATKPTPTPQSQTVLALPPGQGFTFREPITTIRRPAWTAGIEQEPEVYYLKKGRKPQKQQVQNELLKYRSEPAPPQAEIVEVPPVESPQMKPPPPAEIRQVEPESITEKGKAVVPRETEAVKTKSFVKKEVGPQDLIDIVLSEGGISPDDVNIDQRALRQMGMFGKNNIIRKSQKLGLDELREEILHIAGLPPNTSTDELGEMIIDALAYRKDLAQARKGGEKVENLSRLSTEELQRKLEEEYYSLPEDPAAEELGKWFENQSKSELERLEEEALTPAKPEFSATAKDRFSLPGMEKTDYEALRGLDIEDVGKVSEPPSEWMPEKIGETHLIPITAEEANILKFGKPYQQSGIKIRDKEAIKDAVVLRINPDEPGKDYWFMRDEPIHGGGWYPGKYKKVLSKEEQEAIELFKKIRNEARKRIAMGGEAPVAEAPTTKGVVSEPEPTYKSQRQDLFDILKSEKGAIQLPEKEIKAALTQVRKYGLESYKKFGSPYRVLALDKSGAGKKIWDLTYDADRKGEMFEKKFKEAFIQNIKIAPETEASNRVGALLDTYESWEHIPAYIQQGLPAEEAQAFKFMRESWDKMADVLIEKGLMERTRKIKSYLFHVFDKDTIYNAWKQELEVMEAARAAEGAGFKQSAEFKKTYERLQRSIELYERTGTILYDYLPKSLRAPFLKERTGATGYSFDAVRAFELYEYYFRKKLYDEPALKASVELMKKMDPELKEYTRKYLRRFIGMDRPSEIKNLEMALTSLEWIKDLGFSTRSAIVNSTQLTMTAVEIGPQWALEGVKFAMTPEGKKLFDASGHKTDIPSLRWGMESKKHPLKTFGAVVGGTWQDFRRAAGYLFDKVELVNRQVSYLGAYKKAISEGKSHEEATRYGDEVVMKTQGIYGRTGQPMGTGALGGSIGFQFVTTPIKMGETFVYWAVNNPKKILAYVLLASALSESLKELGLDMSNVLGVGVDNRELVKAMVHLLKGEGAAFRRHAKMGLPFIPIVNPRGTQGSGIFPTGFFPAIDTIQDVLSLKWEKWIPLQAKRMIEGGAAVIEGKIKIPVTGEEGYPIRNIRTGEITSVLSGPQVFSRTFLAQPRKESEQRKALSEQSMIEEQKREHLEDLAKALISKNQLRFKKLLADKEFPVTSGEIVNAFEKLWKRKNLSPIARKQWQVWADKHNIPIRMMQGESPYLMER